MQFLFKKICEERLLLKICILFYINATNLIKIQQLDKFWNIFNFFITLIVSIFLNLLKIQSIITEKSFIHVSLTFRCPICEYWRYIIYLQKLKKNCQSQMASHNPKCDRDNNQPYEIMQDQIIVIYFSKHSHNHTNNTIVIHKNTKGISHELTCHLTGQGQNN